MFRTVNFPQSARISSGVPSSGAILVTNVRGRFSDRRDTGGDVDVRPAAFMVRARQRRETRR